MVKTFEETREAQGLRFVRRLGVVTSGRAVTAKRMVRPSSVWSRLSVILGMTLMLGMAMSSSAQVHQVNTYTTGDQWAPAITQAEDGSFFVVWESNDQDGSAGGIFGRYLDSTGLPVGSEIQINTYATGSQRDPSVDRMSDGRFVVVWRSRYTYNQDEVRGRFIDPDGVNTSAELVLNDSGFVSPEVDVQDDGDFMVVWGDPIHLVSQVFDSTGTAKGDKVPFSSSHMVDADGVALETFADGSYLVAWELDDRVHVRHLAADGTPLAGSYRIDSTEEGQFSPSMVRGDGFMLVTWNRNSSTQRIQKVAEDGTLSGSRMTASVLGSSATLFPQGDDFLLAYADYVTWQFDSAVFGQTLDSSGAPLAERFRVSSEAPTLSTHAYSTGREYRRSKIAETPGGDLVVVWTTGVDSKEISVQRIPDFRINVPELEIGCVGFAAQAEIEVASFGSTAPVTLTVPDGYTIEPQVVTPPGTAILTTAVPTEEGRLIFEVSGDDGFETDSTGGDVWNYDYLHSPYSPADGAEAVSVAPTLKWAVSSETLHSPYPGELWYLELARDASFLDIVEQATLTRTFIDVFSWGEVHYQPKVLEPSTQYFWRVRADLPCGPGQWIERSFTTAPDFVVASEYLEGGNYHRGMTLQGNPSVAPGPGPGTFVVSYPGFYDSYYNEVYGVWMEANVEVVGPVGSTADRFRSITLPQSPFPAIPSETDVNTPVFTVPSGGFVVVWGGDEQVVSQGHDSSGGRLDFGHVVGTSPERRTYADAAGNPSTGEQLVVWADRNADPFIAGRRVASDGSPIGDLIQISSTGVPASDHPAVAWSEDRNDFLVVWQSEGAVTEGAMTEGAVGDADGMSIVGRRVASDGSPVAADFQINSYVTGHQERPSLAAIPGTVDFLVVWQSGGSPNVDQDGNSILARKVGSGGPAAPDFQINSFGDGNQTDPDIAVEPGGGAVLITWKSEGSSGDDNSGTSIQARQLAPNFSALGSEFQVNSLTSGDQYGPRAAAHPTSHEFMVVWRDETRILGKHIAAGTTIFVDGFESGNVESWSSSVP